MIVDDTIMLTNMHVAEFRGNISLNSSDLTELKVYYNFFLGMYRWKRFRKRR